MSTSSPILLALRQRSLNHPNTIALTHPHVINTETRGQQQIGPTLPGALQARAKHHHGQIGHSVDRPRVTVGQNILFNQQLRVAGFHGRLQVIEDDMRFLVGPVVEDVFEVVCPGLLVLSVGHASREQVCKTYPGQAAPG